MNHQKMFLESRGWTVLHPVGQDSSIRRYYRIIKHNKTAILMETVPDGSVHATPGHAMADFIRIAGWLADQGLKTPEIYEVDTTGGYMLLEDLGQICFKQALGLGQGAQDLYLLATRVLETIAAQDCPLDLPNYYDSHVHKRNRRVIDFYAPLVRGIKNEDDLVEQYRAVWADIESGLPPCPQGFLHIDFHAENLMWMPEEQGLKRCGILDFQGAMIGPAPYDLANLLEDARTDVPKDLRVQILSRFDENTQNWYRVLATQFHCRVIGQFIKQAVQNNNATYLPHIPRLEAYLRDGLKHPVLAPLKHFFDDLQVDFSGIGDLNTLEVAGLISPDAS